MNNGRIKLHRKILDSFAGNNLELIGFMSMCLLKANHKENTFYLGYQKITLKPGQFISSVRKLSEQFGMSKSKVYRILNILENEKFMGHEGTTKHTIFSIINRNEYQDMGHEWDTSESTSGTKVVHKQECKEGKNEKKYILELENTIQKWNSIKKIGDRKGLKYCRGVTVDIEQEYKKLRKKYSVEDFALGVNNYIIDIKNRNDKDGYAEHRFSFYEFVKQNNGFKTFYNK